MVNVIELNSNEKKHFIEMREAVMEYGCCDGDLYKPTESYKKRVPKKSNTSQLYPNRSFWFGGEVPDDCRDWPVTVKLYIPETGSGWDQFDENYVRCWFVYLYRRLLPTVFNSPLFERFDWMYERLIESMQLIAGGEVYGKHYDLDMHLVSPEVFKERSKMVLEVMKDWAPVELKRLIMAKIPKNIKNMVRLAYNLSITMFEISVITLNSSLPEADEREIVDRLLEYIFKGPKYIDMNETCVLQSFFAVLEVSRVAAEQTIRKLKAGKKDLNENDQKILHCFNECRFTYELLTTELVPALEPKKALANSQSKREAKRVIQLMDHILELNAENMKCNTREKLFIQPGKYLLELGQDKTLRQDSAKLSDRIAATYPAIVSKIHDTSYEVLPITFAYNW